MPVSPPDLLTAKTYEAGNTECQEEQSGMAVEREIASLFRAHRTSLLRYLVATGLGAQDAEEVLQETFLALFHHLRKGRSRRNLHGWLFRVAHNQALKQRRRNSQRYQISLDDSPADHVRDPMPSPEDQLDFRQRRSRLRSILKALSETDRCCIHLRAEGLRYREIAEVLGISLGSVAVSMSRSLSKLMMGNAQ